MARLFPTIALLACLAAGCGVTREELKKELDGLWARADTADRRAADAESAARDDLAKELTAVRVKSEQEALNLARKFEELGQRIDQLRIEVAKVAAVTTQVDKLREDSQKILDKMKQSYDTFVKEAGSIQDKVKDAQDKTKEVIRFNLRVVKEQYTYLSNLLQELERSQAGGGGAPPGGGGAGNSGGQGGK
ncbi:MAG: hypothetical protein L0216_21730 [Planctomycetales bacterium]|nr:hypothetical protein [Planctomycetales bacterium]